METGQALALFSHLYGGGLGGDYFEIRTLPQKKQTFTRDIRQAVDSLRGVSGPTNVYFGLCPRLEHSGKESSTSSLPAIFVDFDFKDYALGRAEVEHKIDRMDMKPTAVVGSGNGFHAYWRLRKAPVFRTDEDRTWAKGVLAGFSSEVGGDTAASRITGCPRVPGSRNHKKGSPKEVEIASQDNSAWYDYGDFKAFFIDPRESVGAPSRQLGGLPPPPASLYSYLDGFKWMGRLWSGVKDSGDRSRSGMDWSLAIKLRKYCEYTHEEIAACLLAFDYGKARDMPRRYLEDTVNRAVSYADTRR